MRLSNKTALVTGAASGIGRAVAIRLAADGARVVLGDRDAAGLAQTAEMIGDAAITTPLDVADEASARAIVDLAVERHGGLDILCNIAGFGGLKAFTEETAEGWQKMFSVNVHGPFYLSQAALPHLLASKGNIVNVASTAGLIGQAYMATYTASKHALVGLTKSMALEFGRKGLRVNAICPGGTTTPFLQAFAIPQNAEMDLIGRVQLLPDYAAPEDIANMICFTASDEAKFVNGALLSVDGGTVAG